MCRSLHFYAYDQNLMGFEYQNDIDFIVENDITYEDWLSLLMNNDYPK